jgi:hypothetical protein
MIPPQPWPPMRSRRRGLGKERHAGRLKERTPIGSRLGRSKRTFEDRFQLFVGGVVSGIFDKDAVAKLSDAHEAWANIVDQILFSSL